MVERRNEAQRLAGNGQRTDAGIDDGVIGNADIDITIGDLVLHLIGAAKFQVIADAWIDFDEFRQCVFDKVAQKPFTAANAHTRLLDAAQLVQLFGQHAAVFEDTLGMFIDQPTSIGQSHTTAGTVKQRQADVLFGIGYLPADDRGGHAKMIGSTSDRSAADDSDEHAQGFCVERFHKCIFVKTLGQST